MSASLTFAGAAGTVTGSKHWVRTDQAQILLDCGLFQGLKALRLRNWEAPPFEPRALDAIVLSHAHLDHSGYLPLLVKRGFRGPIWCTRATADLVAIVLRDSARLQEEDAERANARGYTKHHPALPLYTTEDADRALGLLETAAYGAEFTPARSLRALFRHAGHILGSATVELRLEGPDACRLVFSGDLGRWSRPILRDPELVPEADVLLVESTYGDRIHATDPEARLCELVNRTAHRGGVVVVPAFSIGRTQELLFMLRKLEDEKRLPLVSVYLDSPMAINVTELYTRHTEEHDLEMARLLDEEQTPLRPRNYHIVRTTAESKELNGRTGPMVIIAGSGMATGGRVLHHLAHRLSDHRNAVLLTGFQAAGTRGRSLQDGARTLRIHGRDVPVRAEIATVDGLSAHADRGELMRWLRGFERPPRQTYVVHGEPQAASALAALVEQELGWAIAVAEDGATVPLGAREGAVRAKGAAG